MLLDTNALIWMAHEPARLGRRAELLMRSALMEDRLCYCVISLWEIGMLHQKNRLSFDAGSATFRDLMARAGVQEIDVSGEMAVMAGELDGLHGDPADRLIIAAALVGDIQLVTSDRKILAWDGPLKAVDARA